MDHQDLREFPFFKVIHGENVYIFVGSKSKYKDMYASNARLQKGLGNMTKKKIHHVKETIFHDDPICTVKRKIQKALGIGGGGKGSGNSSDNALYMWCKQRVQNQEAATLAFLENVFANRRLVSHAELAAAYHHVTGSTLALDGLASDAAMSLEDAVKHIMLPKKVLKTLGFSRVDGSMSHFVYYPIDPADWTPDFSLQLSTLVDEHAHLIGDDVADNVIYVAVGVAGVAAAAADIYMPDFETVSLAYDSTQLEEMRDFSRKPSAKIMCYPSFIQVRVQGDALENNLYKTFTQIEPTPEIPFLRWMSVSNTFYKLHKSFMTNYSERAIGDITTWTKPAKYFEASKEHLIAKIPLSLTNIATMIVEYDGSYSIRINYRKNANANLKNVMNHIAKVHETFSSGMIKLTTPYVKHLWSSNGNIQIVKMICGGKISDNENVAPTQKLENAIDMKLTHVYASQTSRAGFVELLYKRFNGFIEFKNILQFMNKFNSLDRDAMVTLIMYVFSLEKDFAISIHKNWLETQKNKNNFYTKRIVKMCKVFLRPRKNMYEFAIDGATSLIQVRRILHSLMYLIHVAKDKSVAATKKKSAAQASLASLVSLASMVDDEADDVAAAAAAANADADDDDDDATTAAAAAAAAATTGADDDDDIGFAFDIEKDDLDQFFHQDDGSDDDDDGSDDDDGNDDNDYDDTPVENIDNIKRSKVCPSSLQAAAADKKKQKGGGLLSRLKDADKKLFLSNKEKRKRYSTTCQGSDKRYPVVMSKEDTEYNQKCFPGALTGVLNIGSTPELEKKNFYTCPKVWCPKSRVALTMDQFKKTYHSKCPFPNINEEPQVIDTNKWKGRERHIMYLSPTRHSKNLCMPCCGLKPLTEKNNKCVTLTQSSNTKYIKDRGSLPLEEGRYGLLPLKMTGLFKNEYCGDKGGQHGLMNEQTNCFLRFGLPARDQVFFQCMIACLENEELKSSKDVVDLIIANLDMQQYIALGNGIICKAFMPVHNTVHEVAEFEAFRSWFLGKDQAEYRQRFNQTSILSAGEMLKKMTNLSLDVAKKPRENLKRVYKEILREFQLYQSFQAYLAYIKDDLIVKKHEYIFPLLMLEWMNPNKYNMVILEEEDGGDSFASCPIYLPAKYVFDPERPTVIVVKQGAYYEPIHHIYYDKLNGAKRPSQIIDRIHMIDSTPRVKHVLDTYLSNCADSYFDENGGRIRTLLDASAHSVKAQILDFKFHVVAFYTRTNVIIPLKQPIAMDLTHPSTFVFIDTCLKNYKFEIKDTFVKGILNAINTLIPGYYKPGMALKINGEKAALKLQDIDILIPLKPYYDIVGSGSGIYEQIVKDGAIFTMYEDNDPRKSMVSMSKYVEILFATLKNEIVNIVQHVRAVKDVVDVLRHPSNPMPSAIKRRILVDTLSKYVEKIIFKGAISSDVNVSERANAVSVQRGMTNLCSTIGKFKMCINQCSKSVIVNRDGNQTTPQCKLSVPKDYYELLLERCYEFILNPISELKIEKVISEAEMVNNDVIVFSRQDVDKQGVNAIVEKFTRVGTTSFEKVMMDAVMNAKAASSSNPRNKALPFTLTVTDKPTMLAQLNEFTLYKVQQIVGGEWLLELFTLVNKRINPPLAKLSVSDLKLLLMKKIRSSHRADPVGTFELLFLHEIKPAMANTEENVMAWAARTDKLMTEYELEILSMIANVNVFLTSRQTKRTPDKMRCLGKHNRDYYLFLHQSSTNNEYQLYMKKDNKYLLTRADFGDRFGKCVLAKCSRGFVSINGNPDDVCPPYK